MKASMMSPTPAMHASPPDVTENRGLVAVHESPELREHVLAELRQHGSEATADAIERLA